MSEVISIQEFRGRRKPSPLTTSAGETYLLRPVSLFSMMAAGAIPSDLWREVNKILNQNVSSKDTEEHPEEYTRLINLMILFSVVEPKFTEGPATEKEISIDEMDDKTKIEIYTEIMKRYNKLEDEAGHEVDLKPFPSEPGGDSAGSGGKILEPETKRTGGDPGGPSKRA